MNVDIQKDDKSSILEMASTKPPTEGQIIAQFKQLNAEYQSLSSKVSELELELHEHDLVIGTISKLESSRKCFRLIGGVLVERTVGEVLPAVIKNKEGISEIIQALSKQMEEKMKELNEFKHTHKIQVRDSNEDEVTPIQSPQKKTTSLSGVLA